MYVHAVDALFLIVIFLSLTVTTKFVFCERYVIPPHASQIATVGVLPADSLETNTIATTV